MRSGAFRQGEKPVHPLLATPMAELGDGFYRPTEDETGEKSEDERRTVWRFAVLTAVSCWSDDSVFSSQG